MSCPHTPQQNGVAERKHRHVTELGLSLMFQSKVPQQLWVDAFLTAVYLLNLLPTSNLPRNISPYEALVGTQPVYTSLRVFGSSCYPFLRPYGKNKFDPKSLHCVFLGYSEKHKGYRCLHPPTVRVYVSRHVLFDEKTFPYETVYQKFLNTAETPLLNAWRSEFITPPSVPDTTPLEEEYLGPLPQQMTTDVPQSPEHVPSPPHSPPPLVVEDSPPPVQNVAPVHPMVTRGKDGIRKPNPRYVLMSVKNGYPEPKSVVAALKDPKWTASMGKEINNMEVTHTWDLVPPEENAAPISCGWVFKSQFNADGSLKNRKSRLVARGNQQ